MKTTEVIANSPQWQNEATLVKYQLWSTVLGEYITALKDDGAKETTKVYAGGAVIAEQVTRYGNEVYWIHADPVTGSSTKTTKTGAEYTRKEYEPFGQEVSTFEPEEEFPAPEGNADNLVDANDPHWQCQMADAIGTNFWNKPVHCQRSAMLGMQNRDILKKPRNSPNHIASAAAAQSNEQAGASGMPANPTPTDKPTLKNNSNLSKEERAKKKADALAAGEQSDWEPIKRPRSRGSLTTDDLATRLSAATALVKKHVKFITTKEGNSFDKKKHRDTVYQSLVWLLADSDCEEAFKKAKIPTPADDIKKYGLTLAAGELLLNAENNKTIGINETDRKRLVKEYNNLSSQAFTYQRLDKKNRTGRIFTFYKNSAFIGASTFSGTYSTAEIVVHEMVHGVGVPGKAYKILGKTFSHDLYYYKHYQNILKKCRIDK